MERPHPFAAEKVERRHPFATEKELPEVLLIEILLRLPYNDFYRCNCVSKNWRSIISEIKQLHHARSLGIVISQSKSCSFFQSTLGLENNNAPPFIVKSSLGLENNNVPPFVVNQFGTGTEIRFTEVINGLFCFYTFSTGELTLCNCYTFEMKKLPLPRYYHRTDKRRLYLGYDPYSGSYKLLSLSGRSGTNVVIYKEVLVLGGVNGITMGSWKVLMPSEKTVLFMDIDVLCTPSVCINGFLYWLVKCSYSNKWKLYVFLLAVEGFCDHIITKQLVDESDLSTARIVNFKGKVAVGCLEKDAAATHSGKLDLWEFSSCHIKWIKHSITLPKELVRGNLESWCSVGNLPTGELLLANAKANYNDDDSSFTPIYSYDHSNEKFQRFVVSKFPYCMVAAGEKSSFQISFVLNSGTYDSLEALFRKDPTTTLLGFQALWRKCYLREYFRSRGNMLSISP